MCGTLRHVSCVLVCWVHTHTQGESADPGGHDLGSDHSSVATELRPWATHTHTHTHCRHTHTDPSSVAAELGPGQHTQTQTHTHTHPVWQGEHGHTQTDRDTHTHTINTLIHRPPVNTHTDPSSVAPELGPWAIHTHTHTHTHTHPPVWQGEHGLSSCLPNPGISAGHVRARGYVAWSSVGQGQPAAGLWAPR